MRALILPVLLFAVGAHAQSQPAHPEQAPRLGADGPGDVRGRAPRALFISPMGEPFRVPDPDKAWFAGADTNHDARIVPAEFRADARRFFLVLDRAGDGEIDPDDIDFYENRLAPEIRVRDGAGPRLPRSVGPDGERGERRAGPGGGGGRGGKRSGGGSAHQGGGEAEGQGAARYGYLGMPEPVTPADRNFNRGIDIGEFLRAADERFALLDRDHDGAITARDLPAIDTRVRGGFGGGSDPRPHGGMRPPTDDARPED